MKKLLIIPILLMGCTSITGVNESHEQPGTEPVELHSPLPESRTIDASGLEEPDPCYWGDPCHQWIYEELQIR